MENAFQAGNKESSKELQWKDTIIVIEKEKRKKCPRKTEYLASPPFAHGSENSPAFLAFLLKVVTQDTSQRSEGEIDAKCEKDTKFREKNKENKNERRSFAFETFEISSIPLNFLFSFFSFPSFFRFLLFFFCMFQFRSFFKIFQS